MSKKYSIYRFLDKNNKVIYIGRSVNITRRMSQHFSKSGHLIKECYDNTEKIEVAELNSKNDMRIYEIYYISKYKPFYNKEFKNNESISLILPELKWIDIEDYKIKNEYRDYILLNTSQIDNLFSMLNDNDLMKFIFLSTYMRSDGLLTKSNWLTLLSKKDIQEILKLERKGFTNFYKKMIENNLIYFIDNKHYINQNYICKRSKDEKLFIRVYCKANRDIFNTYDNRRQKAISFIYKLSPYINRYNNALCSNIEENNFENIKFLNYHDICNDILKRDSTHITRMKECFNSYEIDDMKFIENIDNQICINPYIISYNNIGNSNYEKLIKKFIK